MENPFEIIMNKLDRVENLLTQIALKQNSMTINLEDKQVRMMNIDQVAVYLNLAKPTIYGYTMRRIIPHSKRGKRLYFIKSDIDNWIASHRQKTTNEIEEEGIAHLLKRPKRRR